MGSTVNTASNASLSYGLQPADAGGRPQFAPPPESLCGYPIVLTIHDEILSEVDAAFGSADEYAELMSRPLAWAEGLPLVTKAWEGDRYAK